MPGAKISIRCYINTKGCELNIGQRENKILGQSISTRYKDVI